MGFPRMLFGGVALVCAALLGVAFFMEHVMGLEPCPLCMFQRWAVLLTGLVALVAFAVNPRGWGVRVGGGLMSLMAAGGLVISGRQVWLQNRPEGEIPPCGMSYEYMRDVFPLWEVFEMAFVGSGDCAEIQWQFLGLSIPGWTSVFFVAMISAGLWLLIRGR